MKLFQDSFDIPEMSRTLHSHGSRHLDLAETFDMTDLLEVSDLLKRCAASATDPEECGRWIRKIESSIAQDQERDLSVRRCPEEMI
eukprot:4436662-Lingulodinium_polyedra.AAC.1